MTSPASSLPGRRGRRILAASAALGLVLGLSACTIGEVPGVNDTDTASTTANVADTQTSGASETTTATSAPGTSIPASEESLAQTAAGLHSVDTLIVNADDIPGLGLEPTPAEDIALGLNSIGDLTAGLKTEPADCMEVNQDALLKRAEPGNLALQSGNRNGTEFAITVTTLDEGLSERRAETERCPVVRMTMPFQGTEVTSETRSTVDDVAAPAGVRDFAAVTQVTTADMMGQFVESGIFTLTGMVEGLGVSVTASAPNGPVAQADKDFAVDIFARQAQKIRDHA